MDGIVVKLIEQAGVAGILQVAIGGIIVAWIRGTKKKLDTIESFIPTMKAVAEILPKIEKILLAQAVSSIELDNMKERLKIIEAECRACRHERANKGGC
jgi:1-acyl-sn-glycerol-3-phosphate acyltransferase